jgi:acyl-CoA thioesterase YciA
MTGAPNGSPAIRTVAMPADTNPAGDIFGGWLMSQMDLAAGNLAALTARGRSATIAVEGMKFHRPVKVGDEVSLFAEIVRGDGPRCRSGWTPGAAAATATTASR